ncbi:Sorting nexin-3 [Entamoeba marina]
MSGNTYAQYEYLEVGVSDPTLKEDASGKYTAYKVHFETTFEEYRLKSNEVYRRYSQFVTLKKQLEIRFEERRDKMQKFGSIPQLPGDTLLSLFGSGRFDSQFVADRCAKLDRWIKAIATHNLLRFENIFISFLQDENWEY